MLSTRNLVSLLALGAALGLGCGPGPELGVGLHSAGRGQPTIVNGTRDPQAVALSDSQIRAIGWLYYAGYSSQPFCTGTLVAPDLVVTAAHCVYGVAAGEIGFGVGVDPAQPEGLFLSTGVFANGQVDAALIRLGQDVTQSGLDITPIAINQAMLDSGLVGQPAQAGGYGETYDALRDGRWFATVYVSQVNTSQVVVDGRGDQGICYGDSGSALIRLDAGGTPVVLAVESGGDDTCVDIDYMTRLDPIFDWIGPVLDGVDPPDPCEGVTSEGRCEGQVAVSCRRSTLQRMDCAALGTECVWVAAANRYACACGDLDAVGRCDGNNREYCREGRYVRSSCDRWGGVCSWDGSAGIYDCINSATCRVEDADGRCQNEVAYNCRDNQSSRQLCSVEGLVCVVEDQDALCVDPATLTPAGGGGDVGDPKDQVAADEGCGCASGVRPRGALLALLLGTLLLGRRRAR